MEVIRGLDAAAIPSILLKGASIQALLYTGENRSYGDTDILVAPDDRTRAEQVLRGFGFERTVAEQQTGWGDHSLHWMRRSDDAQIDLHTTLWGVGVSRESVWACLNSRTSWMQLGNTPVRVLKPSALAMHIALHATQHAGQAVLKPTMDLERAVALLDELVWTEARRTAEALQATPAMSLGLQLVPAGAELAERLGLGHVAAPLEVGVTAAGGSPTAIAVARLAAAPGFNARLRLAASRLVPPKPYMTATFPGARRGRVGLLSAHARRWARIGREMPRALREQRRLKRISARDAKNPVQR